MKVLMSAYACEPGKGSESMLGWNWARQAARFHEVTVLTRANNRHAIERELNQRPVPNLHFVYHDLPRWARFWIREDGPSRAFSILGVEQAYYLLWQLSAVPACRRLHGQFRFDVAHQVTFAAHRQPSCLGWLPCPFILGPVGGGERAPLSFYPSFGALGAIQEMLRDASNVATHLDPLVRHTRVKSNRILAATEETRRALPRWAQRKTIIVPNVGIEKLPEPETKKKRCLNDGFSILYGGRLLHWKGVRLAICAFAELANRVPDATFTVAGDGPDLGHLKRLAAKLGLGSRVQFQGTSTREEFLQTYSSHDVLLFPSLHDSGGFVPVEAMSRGLPVVCLDLGGPAVTVTSDVGIKVGARSPAQTIRDLATALEQLAADPHLCARMGEAGRQRVAILYDWDRVGELLRDLYAAVACDEQSLHRVQ